MARKVFISILGISYYNEAKYYFDNDKNNFFETRFIQEAVLRYYIEKEKIKFDNVYIFLTNRAREANWVNPAQENDKQERSPYTGLSKILDDLGVDYEGVDIPDGNSEEELWQIFDIIYNKLQDNDLLYIDITHSFRSLPIFLTVLMNYVKTLKNVKVERITYGNWEAREKGYAPVIDLTAVNELQNWTIAANAFVRFGQTELLSDLAKQEYSPILRQTKGQNETAKFLSGFDKTLNAFVKDVITNRGYNIYSGKNAKKLKEYIVKLKGQTLDPLEPLLDKINQRLDNLDAPDEAINCFRIVKWDLEAGLIQQAYSMLREGIITYVLWKVFPEEFEHLLLDEKKRELVSSAFKIIIQDYSEDDWNENAKNNKEFIQEIIDFEFDREFIKEFDRLGQLRNDIMHAGFRKGANKSDKLIEEIKKSFEKIIQILNIEL